MKELKWLISDEDFNTITHDYEWDGYVFKLWDNGITAPKDAEIKLHSARFEYIEPDCPFCGMIDRHYELGSGQYKCRSCSRKFSLTSGTYIMSTKLECHYWFRFAYLVGDMKITNSEVIAKDLDITQKTAWGMIDLLREARKENTETPFVNVLVFNGYSDVIDLLLKRRKKVELVWPKPAVEKEIHAEIKPNSAVFNIDALKSIYKTSFSRDIENTLTLPELIKEDVVEEDERKIKELGNRIETILDEKVTKVIDGEVVTEKISDTLKEIEISIKKPYEFGK